MKITHRIKRQWQWFWEDLQKDMHQWRRWVAKIIQGLFLGAAGIIPGLSGSVLAISFGVYDNLMEFVAHPFQNLSKNVRFFLPYGIGAIVGWILLAFVLVTLFKNETTQVLTIYAFLGLMIGSLPAFFKEANEKGGFKIKYLLPLAVAVMAAMLVGWFFEQKAGGSLNLSLNWTVDLLSGCLIGLGTIVPGLSSSVMLIFIGVYNDLMAALTSFDVGTILLVGVGAVAALVMWSRLVTWLIRKWHGYTYYGFIGLTFGSMLLVWPALPNGWLALGAIGLFILGLAGGYYLNKEQKNYD